MSEAALRLEQVYQARTPEQLQQAYQAWAPTYDLDLVSVLGWDKPEKVGEVLRRHTTPAAQVLDFGAGTGLVGAYLAGHGYRHLTALDYSPQMLSEASARGVYQQAVQHDLHEPLPMPDGAFDAAIGVGIFTEGHMGPSCLGELVRVTRGVLVFSLRDDLLSKMAFEPEMERLVQTGRWRLVERVRFDEGLEGRPWSAWVYSVPRGPS